MDQSERLAKALDTWQPDWFIRFSDEQSKQDYLRLTSPLPGTIGYDADAIAKARSKLKRDTAQRLLIVLSAGVTAELVKTNE